jgi:hypothetical protein
MKHRDEMYIQNLLHILENKELNKSFITLDIKILIARENFSS